MDAGMTLALGLLGLVAVIALALTFFILWYLAYVFVYFKRVLLYSFFPNDEQIPLYLAWLTAAVADVVGTLFASANSFGQTIYEKLIRQLPLILGLILLSFGAIAWTEYHDVYIARAMDVYQCFAVPFFYDLRGMTFINLARLVYNVVWPFVRIIARMTRYFLRSLPFEVIRCSSTEILGGAANIGNGVTKFTASLAAWASGPGSITNCTLDTTTAWADITLGTERILKSTSVCFCEATDFIPEIAFGWLSHNSTAALLNGTTVIVADAMLKIPVRTLTGTNKGTVPGVTADYGFVPNLDPIFDDACEIVLSMGQVANRMIYVLVKELVGIFDDTLFVPGSPEEVILAKDWIGFVVRAVCAVIEAARWVYRAVWSIVLVIINIIVDEFGGTPPVPLLCDLREWRALYDFGGRSGLYYKDGGIAGELKLSMNHLQTLLDDLTDPIVGKLAVSPPRAAIDLVFGFLNFLMRMITHGIDSEFRTFSPVVPPRTGIPATTWIPPIAHGPAPLDCPATTLHPGNFWVWLQHHFDDPDSGILMVIDEDLTEFADGLDDLGSLTLPALGKFLHNLIILPVYLVDFFLQSSVSVNIIFTEPPPNYALFISRWRYQRYLDAYSNLGDGLGDSIRELHPGTCVEPSDGIFCAIGDVLDNGFALFDEIGVQIMLVFNTARLQDVQLPNLATFIQNFEDSLQGLAGAATIAIPPFPLAVGVTLQEAVAALFVTFPRAIMLLLTVPNYAIASFQGPLDEMKAGSSFGVIADSLGDWYTNTTAFLFTDATERLCDTSPEALIPAIGTFLDRITGLPVFSGIATAFCILVEAIQVFLTDFALEVIGLILTVFSRFIQLFFNDDNTSFGTRIGNFFGALGDLVFFVVSELPTLLLELFFGLIETLLPSPLKEIFSSVARAIINGLCATLQFFISTVIDVLNFFGATLDPVDLSCGTKKRSFEYDEGRQALVNVMIGAYESSSVVRERVERIRHFMQSMKRTRTSVSNFDDGGDASYGITEDDLVYANASSHQQSLEGNTIHMTMDQAIAALSELADWNGDSMCDRIVLEISRDITRAQDLTALERIHLEDCVTKRAVGEIVSVLPYMHWFPRDGFYNGMSWVRLSMEAVRAYRIFAQYQQDRNLPKEIVLNETYQSEWKQLRVDHLTEENYSYMIRNMTIRDYFERNDGNYEIIRGVEGMWNATKDTGVRFGRYLDNISAVLDQAPERRPLEGWLYGEEYAGGDLPPDIEQRQKIWRSILRIIKKSTNIVSTAVRVGREQQLPLKVYTAALAVPDIVHKGVTWMASEPTEEWEEAVRIRDERLAQHGIYRDGVSNRTASSGIFGMPSPSRVVSSLKEWAAGKVQRAMGHLQANSPRATRNRYIINQFWSDTRSAINTGFLPQDREGTRPYVPKYATGFTELDATGQPVAALATCNTTLVPFCLNCKVLDGAFEQAVIGAIGFADYWDNTYPGYSALYAQTEDYIQDEDINVCGGDGTTELHFPSDLELIGSTTFFDVFGTNDGAFNGFVDFLRNEIGSVINSLTEEKVYGTVRRLLNWPRSNGPSPPRARARALVGPAATDGFIVDYLNNHEGFDPTYDGVGSFADITLIAEALDDFHDFLGDIEFDFDIEPNPFGNGTIEVPNFETNSTGFFTDLFSSFIAADYGYQCEDRFMSLKQGLLLFTVIGVVAFFVLKALGDAVVPETFSTAIVFAFLAMILPFLFFSVTYGTPVQNLLPLPLPIPPPCFANDAMDLLVCDVFPKCPAIVAGVISGPYNEQNCRTCPFEPKVANCKRDYDVRHGLDTALLFMEWWFPSFMDSLRNDGTASGALGFVGVDLTRYQTVDFSDKESFDALVSCIGIMFIPTIPLLGLAIIAFQIVMSIVVDVFATLFGKIVQVFLVVFLLMEAIGKLLTYNFIYVITPEERRRFLENVRRSRKSRRNGLSFTGFPSMASVAYGTVRYVDSSLGISRIINDSNRDIVYASLQRPSSQSKRGRKTRHRKQRRRRKGD